MSPSDATVSPASGARGGTIGGLVRRFWFLGIVALVAVGAYVLQDRLVGGAGDLEVGDCFDLPAETLQEVEEVQRHPCDEPHTAEVILVFEIADGDEYPSDDTFFAAVEERCIPAFAAYTGSQYDAQSTLDLFWFTPGREGWDQGDREISCSLYRVDEASMTQSMRGANPT